MKILQQIADRLRIAFNLKQNKSEKDQPNGYAGLNAQGKINESALPSQGVLDVYDVNSISEMLALQTTLAALNPPKTIDSGDMAIVSDPVNGDKTFVLQTGDPTLLASWREIKTPFITLYGTYNEFLTTFEAGLQ